MMYYCAKFHAFIIKGTMVAHICSAMTDKRGKNDMKVLKLFFSGFLIRALILIFT